MFEVMGSRGVEWGRPVGQQVPASMPGAGGSLGGLGCPGWPVSRLSVFGATVRDCTMLPAANVAAIGRPSSVSNRLFSSLVLDRGPGAIVRGVPGADFQKTGTIGSKQGIEPEIG